MLRLIAAYVQIDKHYCISGRLSTSDTILFVMSTWRTALTRLAGHVNAKTTDTTANVQVPSVYMTPTWVTTKNMNSTVVKDNFVPASQLCTGSYAADCSAAGITP